jgi:hypothetical protein
MRKNNPAVYECKSKKSRAKMHHWVRTETGTAYCKNEGCGIELNVEDATDCFRDAELH